MQNDVTQTLKIRERGKNTQTYKIGVVLLGSTLFTVCCLLSIKCLKELKLKIVLTQVTG